MNSRFGPPILRGGPPLGTIFMDQAVWMLFRCVDRDLWEMKLYHTHTTVTKWLPASKSGMAEPVGGEILADQLTQSQLGWTDYAHHITTCTPDF